MSSSIFPITQEIPYFLSCENPNDAIQIQSLSNRTGISILNEASQGFCLNLKADGAFEIFSTKSPKLKVGLDFTGGEFLYRLKTSGKHQALTKAVGVPKGLIQVLDATGGWGGDAMILASVGCKITICERQPLVALLLENALSRAKNKLGFIDQITLVANDSQSYLHLAPQEFQVIYLDPMYPQKEKSALPRKEMQLLEELVGADEDQLQLFEFALTKATERVVVKRPRAAASLGTPSHSFEGTTTRYDMYLTNN